MKDEIIIEQEFRYAELQVWRTIEGETITQDDITIITNSLNEVFGKNGDVIDRTYIEDDCCGIVIGTENFPFYVEDAVLEPGYPDHITADPYYSYPGCAPQVWCYESIYELFREKWKCPDGYEYDIIDYDFDDRDTLIEKDSDW